jgi:hypothetical protein
LDKSEPPEYLSRVSTGSPTSMAVAVLEDDEWGELKFARNFSFAEHT